MLNWIVWNRTDYVYKNGFGHETQTTNQTKLNHAQIFGDYLQNTAFFHV